jgi:hypothetical protein
VDHPLEVVEQRRDVAIDLGQVHEDVLVWQGHAQILDRYWAQDRHDLVGHARKTG